MSPYEQSNYKDSLWQLATSIGPYLLLWFLAVTGLSISVWISLVLAVIASGFFMRIFIIFHDCGHYSFFEKQKANEITGVITGMLTFFPFYKWRVEHAIHHATSGKLHHRGTGDLWILTVHEYRARSPLQRVLYRLYRNPLVLFGLGPIYLFINARFNRKGAGRKERLSTYLTNLVYLAAIGSLSLLLHWQAVLLVQGVILYVSGVVGVWLFYVQHQFEGTYFAGKEDWDYVSAALQGSSFYKLPTILQWFTGNIGFHHVHHVGPRIPNYNLQRVHECSELLQQVPPIGLRLSLRSLQYRLWDEEQNRFVGFRGVLRNH